MSPHAAIKRLQQIADQQAALLQESQQIVKIIAGGVSTPPSKGLTREQKAALINKRNKTLQKLRG